MAREYKYIDFKTRKMIFKTTQPNHMSMEDVDKMVLKKTGRDPRIERGLIEREIRVVDD